ncbi:MAG: hypothetical protein AAF628_37920, partial [Planctomycetota bacterium]
MRRRPPRRAVAAFAAVGALLAAVASWRRSPLPRPPRGLAGAAEIARPAAAPSPPTPRSRPHAAPSRRGDRISPAPDPAPPLPAA